MIVESWKEKEEKDAERDREEDEEEQERIAMGGEEGGKDAEIRKGIRH